MADDIVFTLYGQPASKSNRREIVTVPKRMPDGTTKRVPRSIKSEEARQFELDALRQIPPKLRVMLDCDCAIWARAYYRTRQSDLDMTVVLDVLQARYGKDKKTGERVLTQRGVVVNDRQFREQHFFWGLDPKNPRVEIVIRPLVVANNVPERQQRELISA